MKSHEIHYTQEQYPTLLARFQAGEVCASEFTSERLLNGIYAQRQAGLYMQRTKLPAGQLTARQLRGLAKAVEDYSQGAQAHITTRQDVQLYQLQLSDTPAVLRLLAEHDVTTREASGNTLRNVTSCHLAGACPHEHADVEPYAVAVSRYFLGHPICQSLPRKFKIGFSGCGRDCAQVKAQDLGFIAERCGDRIGFRVLVGGGLGVRPRLGFTLESFINEADLLPVIEAVLLVFDKHSERIRKNRSRLKFLVRRLGEDDFRQRYYRELELTRTAFDPAIAPKSSQRPQVATPINIQHYPWIRQPTPMPWGSGFLVPLHPSHGNLSANQLLGLAELMEAQPAIRLRITQSQGLLLLGVPQPQLERVQHQLARLFPNCAEGSVVSCTGAANCSLGITQSARTADILEGVSPGLQIRVSGCHNDCVWSALADVGLTGKGRHHHGQLIPSYALRLGGGLSVGIAGPVIPAARLPAAIRLLATSYAAQRQVEETFSAWCARKGRISLRRLLQRFTHVTEEEVDALAYEQGADKPFLSTASGSGECGGGTASPVDQYLVSVGCAARGSCSLEAKQDYSQAGASLRDRLHLTAQALLLAAGEEAVADDSLAEGLKAVIPTREGPLSPVFTQLKADLDAFARDPNEARFAPLQQR